MNVRDQKRWAPPPSAEGPYTRWLVGACGGAGRPTSGIVLIECAAFGGRMPDEGFARTPPRVGETRSDSKSLQLRFDRQLEDAAAASAVDHDRAHVLDERERTLAGALARQRGGHQ